MTNVTAADWHAYVRSAPSFAAAQERIEEALRATLPEVGQRLHAEPVGA